MIAGWRWCGWWVMVVVEGGGGTEKEGAGQWRANRTVSMFKVGDLLGSPSLRWMLF